jgi:hypothetical protein
MKQPNVPPVESNIATWTIVLLVTVRGPLCSAGRNEFKPRLTNTPTPCFSGGPPLATPMMAVALVLVKA